MSGRTVIVTGASSGLGYEIAKYLSEGGNDVIMGCRNKDKADRAIEKIKRTNPNAMATFMQLDLSSKASVEEFVREFRASERKCHVLINNGGVMLGPKSSVVQPSADGIEVTMHTNHLGSFQLTQLLLEDLKAAVAAGPIGGRKKASEGAEAKSADKEAKTAEDKKEGDNKESKKKEDQEKEVDKEKNEEKEEEKKEEKEGDKKEAEGGEEGEEEGKTEEGGEAATADAEPTTGEARVLFITCAAHNAAQAKRSTGVGALDLDDLLLHKEGAYTGAQAYKNSKAASLMCAMQLADKLQGTGVTVNAVNPGSMPGTELVRHASAVSRLVSRVLGHGLVRLTRSARTAAQAAALVCAIATDDKYRGVTGKYLVDGNEAACSEEAADAEKQQRVWALSGGYLHLPGFEELEVPEAPKPKVEEPKGKDKGADKAAAAATTSGEGGEGAAEGAKEAAEGQEEKPDEKEDGENKTYEEREKGDEKEKEDKEQEKTEEKKDDEKELQDKPAEPAAEETKAEEKTEEKALSDKAPVQPEPVTA